MYDLNKFKIIKDLKQDFSSFYSEIKIFCIYEKNPLKLIIYYQGNIELWDVKNKIITNKGENFFLDEGIDKLLKKRRENQMFESLGTLSQKTNKKYKKMNFLAFGNNFCYGLSTKNQVFRWNLNDFSEEILCFVGENLKFVPVLNFETFLEITEVPDIIGMKTINQHTLLLIRKSLNPLKIELL